jgi:hypothetical protein
MSADVSTKRLISHTRELANEMWLAEKIAKAAALPFVGLFAGVTDRTSRAHRARQLILDHKLAALRPSSTRPENFADCYERLYGVPLTKETPALSHSPTQLEVPL